MKSTVLIVILISTFVLVNTQGNCKDIPVHKCNGKEYVAKEDYNGCVKENNKCADVLIECNEVAVKCGKTADEPANVPSILDYSIPFLGGVSVGVLVGIVFFIIL